MAKCRKMADVYEHTLGAKLEWSSHLMHCFWVACLALADKRQIALVSSCQCAESNVVDYSTSSSFVRASSIEVFEIKW